MLSIPWPSVWAGIHLSHRHSIRHLSSLFLYFQHFSKLKNCIIIFPIKEFLYCFLYGALTFSFGLFFFDPFQLYKRRMPAYIHIRNDVVNIFSVRQILNGTNKLCEWLCTGVWAGGRFSVYDANEEKTSSWYERIKLITYKFSAV